MLLRIGSVAGLVFTLVIIVASSGAHARSIEASASSCSCECVEGLPQTLCASVAAAQQQTWVCPPSYTCPLPSVVATGDASSLESAAADVGQAQTSGLIAPHPQAENCRAVRVWHRQMQAYTTVNICDVQAPRT